MGLSAIERCQRILASIVLCCLVLAGAETSKYRIVPAARTAELTRALGIPKGSDRDWLRSHGDNACSRYSSLNQINRDNVRTLKLAWMYHSGDGKGHIQSNPVIVKGVVYGPTAGEYMVAIDGATGREIWRYKPAGRPAHRGLLYWRGDRDHRARLFFTAGEWLYALDPASGKPDSAFGDNGRVAAKGVVAPAVYKQTLVIPCLNVIRAFHVSTGKPLWTFNVIPRAGEFGSDTWTGPGPYDGANCWGGMALDAKRGIVYFSTGSPHPDYLGINHRGNNLFANSVVALNAETGQRLWHFQELRHDIWDLDIPASPNLVTVTRSGVQYDAVAQVTKIGNTLLLDRLTGKPLFPFRLRRAPQSPIAEEQAAEWQPDLELPEPFARQVFTKEDVTTLSAKSRAFVLDRIANADFGWFLPICDGRPLVFYGMHGGAEWTGAAVDPTSALLYVTSNELAWVVNVRRADPSTIRDSRARTTPGGKTYDQHCAACHGRNREGSGMAPPLNALSGRLRDEQIVHRVLKGHDALPPVNLPDAMLQSLLDYLFDRDIQADARRVVRTAPTYQLINRGKLLDQDDRPGVKPPWGTLNAINLNTGRIAWKVPLGEYEELTRAGIPKTGTENFGGAMVTAGGLVFCAGTRDLKIRAFDSRTGTELWEYKLPFGGLAPPATYEVGGRQYIVIAATGGGKLGGPMGDTYVAFALPTR